MSSSDMAILRDYLLWIIQESWSWTVANHWTITFPASLQIPVQGFNSTTLAQSNHLPGFMDGETQTDI